MWLCERVDERFYKWFCLVWGEGIRGLVLIVVGVSC